MWKWIDGTRFGYNNWASAEQVFFDICILIQTIFYNKNEIIKGMRNKANV